MKKIISFLTALALCLCLLPTWALADGDTWYGEGTPEKPWYLSVKEGTKDRYTTIAILDGTTLTISLNPEDSYDCSMGFSTSLSLENRGITAVVIELGFKNVGSHLFENCTTLTDVTLPEGLTSIDVETFKGCTGLAGITFPGSLEAIISGAFEGCTRLTELTFPEGLDIIDSSAFNGCTGLTELTFPESLKSIGSSAFNGCTNLTSLTFPEKVITIDPGAFDGCTNLTTLTFKGKELPKDVWSNPYTEFAGCEKLKTINVPYGAAKEFEKYQDAFPADAVIVEAPAHNYGTEYGSDDNNHWQTCTDCGSIKTEAHDNWLTSSDNDGNVTKNYKKCLTCQHTTAPVTVTVNVPDGLVYGQTGGKQLTCTVEPAQESSSAVWSWQDGDITPKLNPDGALPANLSAGKYVAAVTVKADVCGQADVTVAPAQLPDVFTLSETEFTYDRTEHKPTVTADGLTEDRDYTVAYSNNTGAGTAAVTLTGKGNYTGTVTKQFTIKQAAPTVTAPTAELFYGQKLSDSVLSGGSAAHGSTTVAGTWTWNTPDTQPKENGSYTAAFTPTDTKNYATPASSQVSVSVKPATPKLSLSVPACQAADQDVRVTFTVENPYDAALKDQLPAVTLTYKLGSDTQLTIVDGKFHIPDGTPVGSVITISATAAAVEGKYTAAAKEATVEVTDKIPVEITGVSISGRPYNGLPIQYSGQPVITTLDGQTVTDASVTYTWNTPDGAPPVNAGDYSLLISVRSDKYFGSTTVNFTISKANITITADSLSAYAGSARPSLTYSVVGLADGDSLAAAPTLTCDADMDTIGQYPITASGAAVPAGGNYDPVITYVPGTLTVTAGKDVIILPDPPADVDGTKFQLVMETGISEVPEGLKAVEGVNTTEKLIAVMKAAITAASSGVSQASTAVYDVTLMVSSNDGLTWTPATKENFPSGGLTITLPYPEGTDSSYSFTVVHMFTTSDFGKQPGETEIFTPEQVKNTADGIQVVVTGLSPISVGWEKVEVPAAPEVPGPPSTPSAPSGGGPNGGGNSKPSAVPVEKPEQDSIAGRFTDLGGPGTWYYDAVEFVLRNGLMNGFSSSSFGPDDNLSRAQLAQILYNKEGKPVVTGSSSFVDVADGQWFAPAVSWAAANRIVSGYGNGKFGPDDSISREQLAVMLWRYAGSPAASNKELHFADADKVSRYAFEALCWAVENGVINGLGNGILDPAGLTTRAQTAQMLKNFFQQL